MSSVTASRPGVNYDGREFDKNRLCPPSASLIFKSSSETIDPIHTKVWLNVKLFIELTFEEETK